MQCFCLPEEYFGADQETVQRSDNHDLLNMLKKASLHPLREGTYLPQVKGKESKEQFLSSLSEDGIFEDLKDVPTDWELAIKRLTYLVVTDYHYKDGDGYKNLPAKIVRGIRYYGKREINREDRGQARFHSSCFAIPVCAVNIYFAQMPLMMDIPSHYEEQIEFYNTICELMLQAWTLPMRGDETDAHPFSVERFQNHVWWVGGNALTYRPVFFTALCFQDVRLITILSNVIVKATASRASLGAESFWNEGICADGFGWGHGTQAYNSGYPTDALSEIFVFTKYFQGTRYEALLKDFDWRNICHYIAGISWSSFGDFIPPMMSRHCFQQGSQGKKVSTTEMMYGFVKEIINNYSVYLEAKDRERLEQVLSVGELHISDWEGQFNGTRYFFNNDTLISKNCSRYFYFNMASSRCMGVECAHLMADTRNFYIRDGSYVLLTDPDSYEKAKGTYNPCRLPGITERNLQKHEISPETNWSGYNSIHNFAGGIGYDTYGVAGFIYEKSSARDKDGAGVIRNDYTQEMMGVRAYKSAFVYGDIFVFLGAGITDSQPEYGRNIVTTINNVRCNQDGYCDRNGKYIAKLKTESAMTKNCYLYNDGVLYGILPMPGTDLRIEVEDRGTDWQYLNYANNDVENEDINMLDIFIDHKEAPVDSGYQYWMCTNTDRCPEEIETVFSILKNNTCIQAVAFGKHLISGVFYQPGEVIYDGYRIKVSEPCVLLLELKKEQWRICVCDARQEKKLKTVKVTVERESEDWKREFEIYLPDHEMIGSTSELVVSPMSNSA